MKVQGLLLVDPNQATETVRVIGGQVSELQRGSAVNEMSVGNR